MDLRTSTNYLPVICWPLPGCHKSGSKNYKATLWDFTMHAFQYGVDFLEFICTCRHIFYGDHPWPNFQTNVGARGKSFADMSFIFGRKKLTNFHKNYHLTKNPDIMYRFEQTMNTTPFTTWYYHLLKTGYT